MNPLEILNTLLAGGSEPQNASLPATGNYDSAGLAPVLPGAVNPIQTPGLAQDAAPAPKVLARLTPPPALNMGRVGNAFAGKSGGIPGLGMTRGGAIAAGFDKGLFGDGKGRDPLADAQKRIGMLKSLLDMDRTAKNDEFTQGRVRANDESLADYRRRTAEQGDRRVSAYEESVRSPTKNTRTSVRDVAAQELAFQTAVEKERKGLGLEADDDQPIVSKKMSPEKRAEREAALEAYKKDLRERIRAGQNLTPGGVSGTGEAGEAPNDEVFAAPDDPGPAGVRPPAREDRNALILQSARDRIAQGADRGAVARKLQEEFGIEPALLDGE
jgi:hypothetical protein